MKLIFAQVYVRMSFLSFEHEQRLRYIMYQLVVLLVATTSFYLSSPLASPFLHTTSTLCTSLCCSCGTCYKANIMSSVSPRDYPRGLSNSFSFSLYPQFYPRVKLRSLFYSFIYIFVLFICRLFCSCMIERRIKKKKEEE